MWCVLHCRPGREQEVIDSCKREVPEQVLKDAFVFTYDRMRRYEGEWHMETKQMFPEYVFLDTEDHPALSRQLEETKWTEPAEKTKQELLRQIDPAEEAFLRQLCGENHHLEMSRGYIRDGVTYVTQGPLVGMEENIRKIDRHKRLARIEVPFGELEKPLVAGLEIVTKS